MNEWNKQSTTTAMDRNKYTIHLKISITIKSINSTDCLNLPRSSTCQKTIIRMKANNKQMKWKKKRKKNDRSSF